MYYITLEFLTKHVRVLGPRTSDDFFNQLIDPYKQIALEDMDILNETIESTLESVTHRAGIVLQARIEEMEHAFPNTVMFMDPATLTQVCNSLTARKPNRFEFDCNVRIPWIVTWAGANTWNVIENAAGFAATTDDGGCCNHYRGALTDGLSITA
ncbi:hypothetical protein G3435_01955 [Pseudomonas sp. MAFF212428]|uniref:Uncharacterized protein n=1 Tax=Pseudomonas brassicae TaxID=2708063 RepID=A0A6B3NTA1_9PSED|nr:hypothetical protein [Pseudomonas brassicae]NER59075.1 hypothetical protein [Pseudomonas brassicae]NER64301.1 hypothetical protein [Pseudomonas brassicae]